MKSLFGNSIYNLIYKIFLLAFPLVSSVYVSRILMPVGVGQVAYAQNIVSYFITLAGLGVSSYGIRAIGKVQKSREAYSKVFSELFLITFISTVLCTALFYGWVLGSQEFNDNRMLYIVAGLQLLLSAFNVDWFYQGMEEYKYITSRSILIKVVALVFMFITVKTEDDIVMFAMMSSIALAGNNIINLYNLRKYMGKLVFCNLHIQQHIKPLFIMLSTNLSVELYTKLDTTLLGIMASAINVGYYSYATRITSMVVSLAASTCTILLPRLSHYYQQGNFIELKRTISIAHNAIVTISIPLMVGLFLMANEIIMFLFGSAFYPAATTVRVLTLLIIIKSIGNLYGVQVLLTFGGEKFLLYTTILGAVSNVAINLVLIPMFQENGAATASVISELIVCMIQIWFSRRFVKPKVDAKLYIQIFISCVAMALTVQLISAMIQPKLLMIIISCSFGGIVYYLTCGALKNETISRVNCKIAEAAKKYLKFAS